MSSALFTMTATLQAVQTSLAATTSNANGTAGAVCPDHCSWNGYCERGRCVCEVLWSGGACTKGNESYLMTFGSIFGILTLVAFVQLIAAIYHDIREDSKHKLRDAFRFSAQKWIIFVIWLASGSRAFYFVMQKSLPMMWATSIQSIYYPFVITGCSLLVCFWAEHYYLKIPSDNAHSISASLLAYIGFNVLLYLVVVVMLALSFTAPSKDQLYLHSIFNGVFACVMLFVLIFFLIFGVELFFKVKGAFNSSGGRVNGTQLSLSRVGLVFQAFFQITIVLLLLTDVSARLYQHKLPYLSRSAFDIVCRILELAAGVWFSCCLWNCKRPDTLWILNPRQLISGTPDEAAKLFGDEAVAQYGATSSGLQTSIDQDDCWICYDKRLSSGPLICPCDCKGDVGVVHHNCLRRWLVEQGDFSSKVPSCSVCKKEYTLVHENKVSLCQTCNWRQACRTSVLVSAAVGLPVMAISLWQTHHLSGCISAVIIVLTVFAELVCLKLLGVTIESIWHRAVRTAMTIVGQEPSKRRLENSLQMD